MKIDQGEGRGERESQVIHWKKYILIETVASKQRYTVNPIAVLCPFSSSGYSFFVINQNILLSLFLSLSNHTMGAHITARVIICSSILSVSQQLRMAYLKYLLIFRHDWHSHAVLFCFQQQWQPTDWALALLQNKRSVVVVHKDFCPFCSNFDLSPHLFPRKLGNGTKEIRPMGLIQPWNVNVVLRSKFEYCPMALGQEQSYWNWPLVCLVYPRISIYRVHVWPSLSECMSTS